MNYLFLICNIWDDIFLIVESKLKEKVGALTFLPATLRFF